MSVITTQFPYSAIVSIDDVLPGIGRYHGSGVLIAPDEVLTAAHLVWDQDFGTEASSFIVYPGLTPDGYTYGSSLVQNIHYIRVDDSRGFLTGVQTQYDFALLHLDTSFGKTGNVQLEADPDASVYVHVGGYPVSLGGEIQKDRLITAQADATLSIWDEPVGTVSPGDSGGPVWLIGPNGHAAVVGIAATAGTAGDYAGKITQPIINLLQSWIVQDHTPLYTPPTSASVPASVAGITADLVPGKKGARIALGEDFNGDSKADILWRNDATGDVVEWQMNGTQSPAVTVLAAPPLYLDIVGTRDDLNNDGKNDILWRNTSDGTLVEWLMQGNGILGIKVLPGIPTSYQLLDAAGDANGDGTTDLLLRSTATGRTTTWETAGLSIQAQPDFGTVTTEYLVLDGHSDFNGDGRSDILWRSTATGDTVVWYGGESKISGGADLGTIPTYLNIVDAQGDFNGDGTSDILWRNNANGHVVIWELGGGKISVQADLGVVPLSFSIVDAHGDYNGDGKSDILWRNAANGEVVMWQMNGTQITAVSDLGAVPTSFTIVDATSDYNGDGKSDILWRSNYGQTTLWQMNGAQIAARADYGIIPTYLSVENETANATTYYARSGDPWYGGDGTNIVHISFGGRFAGGAGVNEYVLDDAANIGVPQAQPFTSVEITNFKPSIDRLVIPLPGEASNGISSANLVYGTAIPAGASILPPTYLFPDNAYYFYNTSTGLLSGIQKTQSVGGIVTYDQITPLALLDGAPLITAADLHTI